MAKAPRIATHSASQTKFRDLIVPSIQSFENCEQQIIEIIPKNSKEHRYQSERLRNFLRQRGYCKRCIASAFEGRDLALTNTGLALVPRGDIDQLMVLGENFVLATSVDRGEP